MQTALAESASIPFGPRRVEFIIRRTLKNQYPQALPLAFRLAVTAAAAHDPKLQGEVGRWMEDGREKLERSLRVGIESGAYRPEIGPNTAIGGVVRRNDGSGGAGGGLPQGSAGRPRRGSAPTVAAPVSAQDRGGVGAVPGGSVRYRSDLGHRVPIVRRPQLSTQNAVALASAFKAMYDAFRNQPRPDQDP